MRKLAVALLFPLLAFPLAAGAATIVFASDFLAPGTTIGSVTTGPTPAPNNDNSAGESPNPVQYLVLFNSPGGLDVEFTVSNSGGTTEYFFLQTFVNNTGIAWSGFVFELGFGMGSSFVRSTLADSLDFDASTFDPTPTASVFPTLAADDDIITWSGGHALGTVTFSFSVDIPDGLGPAGAPIRFTLRQVPVVSTPVPEPSTALLLAPGAWLALRRTRSRPGR